MILQPQGKELEQLPEQKSSLTWTKCTGMWNRPFERFATSPYCHVQSAAGRKPFDSSGKTFQVPGVQLLYYLSPTFTKPHKAANQCTVYMLFPDLGPPKISNKRATRSSLPSPSPRSRSSCSILPQTPCHQASNKHL